MTRLDRIIFVLLIGVLIAATLLYGTVHQPILALFYAATAIIFVLWCIDGLWSGNTRVSRSVLQLPLFALVLYGIVQIIPFGTYTDSDGVEGIGRTISVYPFATKLTVVHVGALAVFFFLMLAALHSAHRLRRSALVITVFGFAYAFFAILQSVLSPTRIYGIYETGYAIPFGSFVNRHHFAACMELAIAVPLGLLFTGSVRKDKRLVYIVMAVLMGSALMLSGSRGGLVALACEAILLVLLTSKAEGARSVALKAGLSLALLLAIVGGAVFVGGDTSLTRFAETASSRDITSNRTQIWATTLKVISAHPLVGTGLGAFTQAYARHDTLSGSEQVDQAHNDYLQVVADAGLIGAIIGGAFLFIFFREGLRNSRRHNTFRRGIAVGAFVGCTAVLVHSLFDFVLHTTAVSLMFLTLLAMMVAAGRQYKDDITEFDLKHRRRRSASITPIRAKD